MAGKKASQTAKRQGTMIRVSDEFAAALRDATRIEGTTAAQFVDAHLLPVVRKRYRESVLREATRLEGSKP